MSSRYLKVASECIQMQLSSTYYSSTYQQSLHVNSIWINISDVVIT